MFSTWKSGPDMTSIQAPQQGALGAGPGGWHPTVLYMLALVLAEIVIVAWLSRRLLG